MIRRRNFARTLAAAFLLAAAVALLLLPSAPGHAQTTTNTYVSNIDQGSDSDYTSASVREQSFTTGSQSGGYTVTHVDIGSDDDQGDSFSAAIYTTDASGYPDSEFAALTAPSSFAKGTLTFTAPANTTLAASTTYAVRIVATSNAVKLDATTSDNEDAGRASGWSIGDVARYKSVNTWIATNSGAAIRIAIKHVVAAANNPATGAPTISGTAQVGQMLSVATGSIADADGLTTPGYMYQWIRVDGSTESDISGATASTYTPVAADEGKTIKVKVSFTDDANNAETLTSAATAAVTAAATTTTTYVSNIGQGSDADYRATGVKAQSFTTGSQSGGYAVTHVDIGYEDAEGDKFSAAIYTVDSDGFPGSKVFDLTAPTGSWSTGALTFTAPANTTLSPSTTYTVRIADSSSSNPARLDVTLSNSEDSGASSGWSIGDGLHRRVNNAWTTKNLNARIAVKYTPPATNATGAPTISGTAWVGETLTAATSGIMDSNGLTSVSYAYQWIRVDGNTESDISGAKFRTYTLVDADLGKPIKVKVSFTDDAGNDETLTSAATAAVTAAQTGSVVWEATLTSADSWALGSNNYDGYGSDDSQFITSNHGSLSPNSFTIGATTHKVEWLAVRETGDQALLFFTDTKLGTNELAGYFLEFTVDGVKKTLQVSDATAALDGSDVVGLYWGHAVHSYGASDWQTKTISVRLVNTAEPAAVPDAPLNLRARAVNGEAALIWEKPPDNGAAITGLPVPLQGQHRERLAKLGLDHHPVRDVHRADERHQPRLRGAGAELRGLERERGDQRHPGGGNIGAAAQQHGAGQNAFDEPGLRASLPGFQDRRPPRRL